MIRLTLEAVFGIRKTERQIYSHKQKWGLRQIHAGVPTPVQRMLTKASELCKQQTTEQDILFQPQPREELFPELCLASEVSN